jgi:hypothetical protein
MGNDQPLTAINETWQSRELAINLLSIRTGPMIGKQNFTITDLSVVEPDPELFKLPAGYEIRDMRKNPPIFLVAEKEGHPERIKLPQLKAPQPHLNLDNDSLKSYHVHDIKALNESNLLLIKDLSSFRRAVYGQDYRN